MTTTEGAKTSLRRRTVLAAVAAAVGLASVGSSEAATPAPGVGATQDSARPSDITRVTWAQHPTPMYPAVAAANGIDSGTVTLSCLVEADGSASGCTVLTESPEGAGFGEAALAAMERARFSVGMMETATPGARARFTIRFRLAE